MTLNLSLIGAGGIARAHVAAAETLGGGSEGVRIVGVVDPVREAREKLAEATGAQAFADFSSMWRGLEADQRPAGVVVCTPPSARLEVVEQALAHGLGVLIEKPPAHNLADARRLVQLAEAHPDLPSVVGFCHRFTPAVDTMIQQVRAGLIGSVVRFENTFAAHLPHLQEAWMSDPVRSGGGSLIDTGLHSLDLFRYLFGESEVRGAVLREGWVGRGESNATVLLASRPDTPSDDPQGVGQITGDTPVAGVVACGWAESSRFDLRLVGTQGSLFYDFNDATTLHHTDLQGQTHRLEVAPHDVRFARQLEAFADRLRGTDIRRPTCDFAGGLASLSLVFDAAESAEMSCRTLGPSATHPTPRLDPTIVQQQPTRSPAQRAS